MRPPVLKMKKRNNPGFTLLELMVVIAIAGILASLAVPSYQKMLERNRLKEAAEALKSDMQLARTESIKRSKNVIVTRNAGNNGAWCYGFNDTTTACDCSQASTTATDYCALKRISGSSYAPTNLISSSANTTFTFRRGTANASNACFSTTNYKLKVQVNNLGEVTLCVNNDATAMPGYQTCSSNC